MNPFSKINLLIILVVSCLILQSVVGAPTATGSESSDDEPLSSEVKSEEAEQAGADEFVEDPEGTSGTHEDLKLEDLKVNKFLNNFGYISNEEFENASINAMAEDAFEDAIKEFQKMMNISVTGKVDDTTKKYMLNNRCGNKDIERAEFIDNRHGTFEDPLGASDANSSNPTRAKRHSFLGSKWPRKTVTYKMVNYSGNRISKRDVNNEIDQAFRLWAAASTLKFVKKKSGPADIDIKFVKDQHDGCEGSLSRTTNVLAHAYSPGNGRAGDVHFNDYYRWSTRDGNGYQRILPTAVHEIGHALGVGHSHLTQAVMHGTVWGHTRLHGDDKNAIRALYGRNRRGGRLEANKDQAPKCEEGVRFVKGSTCRFFYFCDDGVARKKFCPASLIWNQEKEWCDYPHNVPSCFESQKEESLEEEGSNSSK